MLSVPLVPVAVIGLPAVAAANCALVIVAPPFSVIEVKLLSGPIVKVPPAVSPVPVGVLPVAKSLSFTCASLPPVPPGPSFRPPTVTTSSTGVTLKLSVFAVEVSTPPLAVPPLSCT